MKLPFRWRKFFLLLGDIFSFFLALIITIFLGFNNINQNIFLEHLYPFLILFPFWLFFFELLGGYELKNLKNSFVLFARIASLGIFIIVSGGLFFYIFKNFGITPKQNLVNFSLFFCLFVFFSRRINFYLYSSFLKQRVAVLGKNNETEKLIKFLKENPHFGWKFVGYLDKNSLQEKISSKERISFDSLILAEKINFNKEIEQIFLKLIPLKIEILTLPQVWEVVFQKIPVGSINGTWFIENLKEGKKEFFDKTKRIFDCLVAGFILFISFPFWLIISLLIKIEDNGPIFYKQVRVGKNGVLFTLWKFRTMIKDAERDGVVWAQENDPRTTRIGRLLRKTHLDELPQMINILKGDISLVGPRPERPEFVRQLEMEIPYYQLRHIIKPGFTGWAQIKFRYARSIPDSQEKFEYDLYYIKHRSFLLDLYILLKTFGLLFKE